MCGAIIERTRTEQHAFIEEQPQQRALAGHIEEADVVADE